MALAQCRCTVKPTFTTHTHTHTHTRTYTHVACLPHPLCDRHTPQSPFFTHSLIHTPTHSPFSAVLETSMSSLSSFNNGPITRRDSAQRHSDEKTRCKHATCSQLTLIVSTFIFLYYTLSTVNVRTCTSRHE